MARPKSFNIQIQEALSDALSAEGVLPTDFKIILKKEKDLLNEIQSALAKLGICVFVLPPIPRQVTREAEWILVEDGELRIRVVENPTLNKTDTDADLVVEAVMTTLHATNPCDLFIAPIHLRPSPLEVTEDAALRVIDVIFTAQYQLTKNQTTP